MVDVLQPAMTIENNNPTINLERVENLIHIIREHHVMLDSDLAKLYGVETKVLNQAVKRNIDRFPEDFMFQLTKEECLRSQIVTLNAERGKHLKYMPYAFTENGVAMLSSVLRSKAAIEVNIRIMRAFTSFRAFLINNAGLFQRMESLELRQLKTESKVDKVLDCLNRADIPRQGLFFDGQIFDAYSVMSDLIRKAKKRLVVIDNYIDDTVLTLLDKRSTHVTATIFTKSINKRLEEDLSRHNSQYPPIEVRILTKAHDRFLIVDDDVYHIGASLKDLGKKLFAFFFMEVMKGNDLLERLC